MLFRNAILCAVVVCPWAMAEPSTIDLQQQIQQLTTDYNQRLEQLEEEVSTPKPANPSAFNPQLSVIIDGRLSHYQSDADQYHLSGYGIGGEAGLASEGFALGHSEITAVANADDKFSGKLTLAIHQEAGETHVEMEEAYLESLALVNGLTLRGGRFFAGIGYLNQQHDHAWDFADAPLVYAAFWGNNYIDDGIRLSFIVPTDIYMEIGTDLLAGGGYPAAGERPTNMGAQVYFINLGGDFNESNSWQSGLSYFTSTPKGRESSGVDASSVNNTTTESSFTGSSQIIGSSFIYKWAPNGNYKNQNIRTQAEFFYREENGDISIVDSIPATASSLVSKQSGFYLQTTFQFSPQWATGIRYDHLNGSNHGNNLSTLTLAGLNTNTLKKPTRYSAMIQWQPSEFSRIRLQFNDDQSQSYSDKQVMLQYTLSLGTHGAHSF